MLADAGSTTLAELETPRDVRRAHRAGPGAGTGGGGDAPPRGAAPRHQPGNIVLADRRHPHPRRLRAGDSTWPSCVLRSPTTPRSWGRWRTWRPRPPGAPAGRWTSGPTCTRWARRSTSSRPVRRRSATGDPLALIHDHLARLPAPPAERNPAVPEPLSRDHPASAGEGAGPPLPERRGPGATTWSGCGTPARRRRTGSRSVQHDLPLRLLPPSRLVGRDEEIAALRGGARRRGRGPVPGSPGQRGARGGQDRAGRPAAAGGHRPGRLVRDRQVRPVPARSGVRRRLPGVPRARPAAAGRAGGRHSPPSASACCARSGRMRGWPPR